MMLLKIAWRNIWRNKARSLVLILSIVLGIWAGTFVLAFYWGMSKQSMEETIATQLSHIQIHHPDFKENYDIQYTIIDEEQIKTELQSNNNIQAYSERLMSVCMVASANASRGVSLLGIIPEQENAVTGLQNKIVEGEYFSDSLKNRAIIGQRLAEKLRVKVNSKIVFTFQDVHGNFTSAAFRIVGLYNSNNKTVEENVVYTESKNLYPLLALESGVHEIAIVLNDAEQTDIITQELSAKFTQDKTESWKQIAPDLRLIVESFSQFMYIIIFIIIIALVFGIINTMLMAILERTRELGVLMAVGLNRKRIFSMIMIETMMIATVGGPLGLLFAFVTITITGYTGIDLSMFTKGFEMYGYSSFVFPELDTPFYFQILIMVISAALFSSLFPAWRALKLKPVEAMRKI